jgi:hypothetical protein
MFEEIALAIFGQESPMLGSTAIFESTLAESGSLKGRCQSPASCIRLTELKYDKHCW